MISEQQSEELLRLFRLRIMEIVSQSKEPAKRNACILNLTMNDGRELIFYSYSSTSSLAQKEKQHLANCGFPLVPDVATNLRIYACGGMGQYHTEPRLVNFFNASPGFLENVKTALIISEINCCPTCLKYTVTEFQRANPNIDVYTDEFEMNPGRKQQPKFSYQGPVRATPDSIVF